MEDLLPLVGGALLAGAVVLFVLLPILRGREAPMARTEEDVSEEDHQRLVALRALRDLEYDRVTGKVDEDDYRHLKADLAREALAALEPEGDLPAPGPTVVARAEKDEAAEAVEAEIARIRRGLRDGRTCRICAHVNPEGSRFCGHCGRPLEAELDASDQVPAGTDT